MVELEVRCLYTKLFMMANKQIKDECKNKTPNDLGSGQNERKYILVKQQDGKKEPTTRSNIAVVRHRTWSIIDYIISLVQSVSMSSIQGRMDQYRREKTMLMRKYEDVTNIPAPEGGKKKMLDIGKISAHYFNFY